MRADNVARWKVSVAIVIAAWIIAIAALTFSMQMNWV